jgi:hypothetical protein
VALQPEADSVEELMPGEMATLFSNCVSLSSGKSKTVLSLWVALALCLSSGQAFARGRELVTVPRFPTGPVFDLSGNNPAGCNVGGKNGYSQAAPRLRIDGDVTAIVQRTDSILYFCFQGIDKKAASPLSEPDHNDGIWVFLDVDDTDAASAGPRDFLFKISPTSLITVNAASFAGPTYGSAGPPQTAGAPSFSTNWAVSGVDAADSLSQRSWHAELRISKSLLGSWHRIGVRFAFNVGIPLFTHHTGAWPLESTPEAPNSWATMLLNDDVAISSGILTNNSNNARTGAYPEQILTPSTVNMSNLNAFRLLHRWEVDGQIYAQPLYVRNLNMPDASIRSVVYVATEHDWVYAFDTISHATVWSRQLGTPAVWNDADNNDKNLYPSVGITSTPVIDLDARLIYVVAHTADIPEKPGPDGDLKHGPNWHYFLHALDIATGIDAVGSPREITATVLGTGAASHRDANGNSVITFDPRKQLNRPGLLLASGRVYVAFGSFADTDNYHGWVMSYDASSLKPLAVFNDTPNGVEGGIWQAGRGLAADRNGNIYVMTANGSVSPTDFSSSFLRLTPDLNVADRYLPENHTCLNEYDLDLGSSGPLLLQSPIPGRGLDLVFGGGKEGRVYLLDSQSMRAPLDTLVATKQPDFVGDYCSTAKVILVNWGNGTWHIHPGPVLWDVNADGSRRLIYVLGENDTLKAWQITSDNKIIGVGMSTFKAFTGMPGGALSVSFSANPSTGLVWASVPMDDAVTHLVRGMLIAFQATPDGNNIPLLWHSEMVPNRDFVGLYSKFSPPTIADGMVFLASFGDPGFLDPVKHNEDWERPGWLDMYGILSGQMPARANPCAGRCGIVNGRQCGGCATGTCKSNFCVPIGIQCRCGGKIFNSTTGKCPVCPKQP